MDFGEQSPLVSVTFEYENGKSINLRQKALAEWQQGISMAFAALLRELVEQQKGGSADASPSSSDSVTTTNEPIKSLKSVLKGKQ